MLRWARDPGRRRTVRRRGIPDDRYHKACESFLRKPGDVLGVSAVVVAEVSYLLKRAPNRPQPETRSSGSLRRVAWRR